MPAVAEPPVTRRLREFHRLGQMLLKVSQRQNQSNAAEVKNYWGVNERLQQKHSLSLNDIACARRFAQLYSSDQLNELCRLGQSRGKPLTKSHLFTLLKIRKRVDRNRWAALAARHGWSVLRLRFEVAAATSRQPSEGRGSGPQYLGSVHALFYTRRLARKWINWYALLNQKKTLVRGKVLGPLLKAVADEMDPLLTELEKAIELPPKAAKARKKSVPKKPRRKPRSRKSTTANNAQRQSKPRPKR